MTRHSESPTPLSRHRYPRAFVCLRLQPTPADISRIVHAYVISCEKNQRHMLQQSSTVLETGRESIKYILKAKNLRERQSRIFTFDAHA